MVGDVFVGSLITACERVLTAAAVGEVGRRACFIFSGDEAAPRCHNEQRITLRPHGANSPLVVLNQLTVSEKKNSKLVCSELRTFAFHDFF